MERVLASEASIRMLKEKNKIDPDEVLTVTPDLEKLQPKVITVAIRLEEIEKTYELEYMRLKTYDQMIAEEKKSIESDQSRTNVEQG